MCVVECVWCVCVYVVRLLVWILNLCTKLPRTPYAIFLVTGLQEVCTMCYTGLIPFIGNSTTRTIPITFLPRLMLIRHTDLLQWRACLCTHLLQGLLTKVNFVALNRVIVFNAVKNLLLSVIQKAGMRSACQMKEYVRKYFYTSCPYVCWFSRWQMSTSFQNLLKRYFCQLA